MAKILKVSGDYYKVKVADEGNIVLDTGAGVGQVRITGDLLVEGVTTTIDSTVTTIVDPVITLNKGETGAGVTLVQSGIEVDRGSLPFARIFYDEDVSHFSPITANDVSGTFTFTLDNGTVVGIKTHTIVSGGSDIILDFAGADGVLTVANGPNYRNLVFADEHIPSVGWMKDWFASGSVPISKIYKENTSVEVTDYNADPLTTSQAVIKVDGVTRLTVDGTNLVLPDLTITNSSIRATNASLNLSLKSDSGKINSNSALTLEHISAPSSDIGFTSIYANAAGSGTTGLYYVNTDNSGELVSKNRALLFSMIF